MKSTMGISRASHSLNWSSFILKPWIFSTIILICTSFFVTPSMGLKTDSEGEIDICDPPDYTIYCVCDNDDLKCGISMTQTDFNDTFRNASDMRWDAIGRRKGAKTMDILNRPIRALTYFPPARIFVNMTELVYFAVKISRFEEIPSFAFANSSTISEVSLMDNEVMSLSKNAFANMGNLTQLILTDNQIKEINREVFVKLPRLEKLFLDRNRIQMIHDRAFKDLKNLEVLELYKNNLTVIVRDAFTGLSNLKKLYLSSNTIEFLGDHAFAEMPLLEDLDLMANKILSVSPTAFAGLKRITTLNLKDNKIVKLLPQTFSHLQMIHFVDLRNNELETLTWGLVHPIYSNLKNVSMQLMIEGNRLICDCQILWIQNLHNETESLSVKTHLGQTMCHMFQNPDLHSYAHHHVKEAHVGVAISYNSNVTVNTNEETTTYGYDGIRNVIELKPSDFKCHEGHTKDLRGDAEAHDDSEAGNKGSDGGGGVPDKVVSPGPGGSNHHDKIEKVQAVGDSEKDIRQSHHSLTEASHSDKSSSSSQSSSATSKSSSSPIISWSVITGVTAVSLLLIPYSSSHRP